MHWRRSANQLTFLTSRICFSPDSRSQISKFELLNRTQTEHIWMPHVNPHDSVTTIFIKLIKNPILKKQFLESLSLVFDQPDVASSPVLRDLPGKPNVRNPRKSLAPAVVESS
ncbi:hypothetical protein EVAR_35697_1 [Eumeta japonica]|uniref:Uncharacterized protein n=1 Tax=Eumeta variegata TaxID=151549 RepID=A0A4C1VH20_EUMVA|nr:hypothetical protein EVAR_35697_1 [Eumeta japonica]